MERTETLTAAAAPLREIAGSYIDWAAVFGGAVVAAAIAGLFTAFGAALGLSTISAERGEGSFDLWLVVTALWIVVSLVASYLAGGYIAGRMRRRIDDASADEVAARDGINGLVVWGLGMLVTAWMAAGVVGGAASAVGSAVGAVGQAAGSALGGAAQGAIQAMAPAADDEGEGLSGWINDTLMRPVLGPAAAPPAPAAPGAIPGTATPAAPATDTAGLARQTAGILRNVVRTGELSDADRAFLVAATAQRTGLSETEAETRVEQAVTAAQEVRAEAERLAAEAGQTAREAAETARVGAILTAFILTAAALVAGAAALVGAVRGGRHRDEGRLFGGFGYRL